MQHHKRLAGGMTQAPSLTPRAWLGLFALAVLWGFSFLSMRVALDEIGPFALVAHRVTWAMVALWLVVLVLRLPVPRTPAVWFAFLVMGLLNNMLPFGLIAWGQQHIETGLASIINAATAIWGVFIAALLLPDEHLTLRKTIGTLLGFAGVVFAVGIDALSSLDLRSMGQLAIIGATISYAFAGVWARKRLRGIRPEVAAAGMLTGGTVLAVPLAFLIEGSIPFALSGKTWLALAYVSLAATALAYMLYYQVLAIAGSGNLMLVTLLLVPVAIVAGAVALQETLPPQAYGGFVLLILGLLIIDGRVLSFFNKALARFRPDR